MESQRHRVAIYRQLPRIARPGRPSKTPQRELVANFENLAKEAADALVDTFKLGLGPGTVIEMDDQPVAWGPKPVESAREVGAGYAASVEIVRESPPPPPPPPEGSHPSEVVRFNIDVAWDTYRRSISEMDDLLDRNRRMVSQAIHQCEHFVTATQRLMELEAEMQAMRAEEKVRQDEAGRQQAQPPPLAERALRITASALGPDHPDVAYSLDMLGALALARGRPADAISPLERALVINAGAAPLRLAQTRGLLARALWGAPVGAGRDRGRAGDLAGQALAVLRAAGDAHAKDVAELEAWLRSREP